MKSGQRPGAAEDPCRGSMSSQRARERWELGPETFSLWGILREFVSADGVQAAPAPCSRMPFLRILQDKDSSEGPERGSKDGVEWGCCSCMCTLCRMGEAQGDDAHAADACNPSSNTQQQPTAGSGPRSLGPPAWPSQDVFQALLPHPQA